MPALTSTVWWMRFFRMVDGQNQPLLAAILAEGSMRRALAVGILNPWSNDFSRFAARFTT
jgi:hypothetical protein